eukprot:TRINITY_DN2341_c1_g1_i1.p1 TRINITY_DN2341_c1_g1~~TRINITY_DN2341_c1_g1_i1.p1  ORF type:complete len:424 (-),score=139.65 TRINITY_DN2341_c1_g1_i1:35-1306(-)
MADAAASFAITAIETLYGFFKQYKEVESFSLIIPSIEALLETIKLAKTIHTGNESFAISVNAVNHAAEVLCNKIKETEIKSKNFSIFKKVKNFIKAPFNNTIIGAEYSRFQQAVINLEAVIPSGNSTIIFKILKKTKNENNNKNENNTNENNTNEGEDENNEDEDANIYRPARIFWLYSFKDDICVDLNEFTEKIRSYPEFKEFFPFNIHTQYLVNYKSFFQDHKDKSSVTLQHLKYILDTFGDLRSILELVQKLSESHGFVGRIQDEKAQNFIDNNHDRYFIRWSNSANNAFVITKGTSTRIIVENRKYSIENGECSYDSIFDVIRSQKHIYSEPILNIPAQYGAKKQVKFIDKDFFVKDTQLNENCKQIIEECCDEINDLQEVMRDIFISIYQQNINQTIEMYIEKKLTEKNTQRNSQRNN